MASSAENILQIKEILFGDERRAIELRLDDLDNRLRKSQQLMREEIDTAVQALRTEAGVHANALQASVASEREARMRFVEELSQQIEQLRQVLDQRLDRLTADAYNLHSARTALEQQLHDLGERVSKEQAEIAAQAAVTEQRLRDEKVDALALSRLFDALAAQLRGAPNAEPTA
jgi:hypothetical protein